MIDSYIIRWEIDPLLGESEMILKHHIFKSSIHSLKNNFNFRIEDYQSSEDSVSVDNFTGETDFMFYPNDRSFNLFYTYVVKDLDLNVVYLNKTNILRLEENYLYCIPYWMPFKFSSEDNNFNQKIISAKVLTRDRPFFRSKEIYW